MVSPVDVEAVLGAPASQPTPRAPVSVEGVLGAAVANLGVPQELEETRALQEQRETVDTLGILVAGVTTTGDDGLGLHLEKRGESAGFTGTGDVRGQLETQPRPCLS